MRRSILLPSLLFLSAQSFATITKYHWTGTVDSGNVSETSVSGSFDLDDSAPQNPDAEPGWKDYDGGLKNVSFNLGLNVYNDFNNWSWQVPPDGKGFIFSNAPLSGNGNGPFITDLIFADLPDQQDWSAFYSPDGTIGEIFGKVTGVWKDAAPTPEPSSFVLMGAALLGFVFVRRLACLRS